MALSELQRPTKDLLYHELQEHATVQNRQLHVSADLAEFIANIEASDLTEMAVTDEGSITDMTDYRTALNELVAFCTGGATTRTIVLSEIIDKIRRMR